VETIDRHYCERLDAEDPLARLRDQFELPDGLLYFDGNSLGPLTRGARQRVERVVRDEWGKRLIAGWESGWLEAPVRVGDTLASLIGAGPGEVIVSDSTTVNLYKLALAALELRPSRRTVVTQDGNFPTDLYVTDGIAGLTREGVRVRRLPPERVTGALDGDVALVLLSHVDYRTGRMYDMAQVTSSAHACGALVLWDLCHSAGAVPIDLAGCGADLAAGCTYKFLNGGPGAPAFLYVARSLQASLSSPIPGWLGHADPFAFADRYEPAPGVRRFLAGTPGILAMAALEGALGIWEGVDLATVREKSVRLGQLLIGLADERCAGFGVEVASPRDPAQRGSQVSLRHPMAGRLSETLAGRGVVTDFRPPDLVRFGLTPLYTRFVDLWDAMEMLRSALVSLGAS
jgi:kynureninase